MSVYSVLEVMVYVLKTCVSNASEEDSDTLSFMRIQKSEDKIEACVHCRSLTSQRFAIKRHY